MKAMDAFAGSRRRMRRLLIDDAVACGSDGDGRGVKREAVAISTGRRCMYVGDKRANKEGGRVSRQ